MKDKNILLSPKYVIKSKNICQNETKGKVGSQILHIRFILLTSTNHPRVTQASL